MGLQSNITNIFKDREPFWGKYSFLNSIEVPDKQTIKNYQLLKIKSFQNLALRNKNKGKIAKINKLFKSGVINNLGNYQNQENQSLDQAISHVVGMLNGTYKFKSKDNSKLQYDKLQKHLSSLQKELLFIKKQISINTPVYESTLTQISNLITLCQNETLSGDNFNNWTNTINKLKGEIVEEIGAAWLSQLNIPNITTIKTGNISLQGTQRANRHNGMIIQDLMILNVSMSNTDLLNNITIEYKTTGQDKYEEKTLNQFFQDLEKCSNSEKNIQLNDNGYDTLLELSALNIQAKSGFNQRPWNINKSTSVSIGEFNDNSIKKTFSLLQSLDYDEQPKDIWVKNSSRDYNALANYGLATVLDKVLHLNEKEGNQYLLTPSGFITYTERMTQLFKKSEAIANIRSGVTINQNTLGTKYPVGIIGYK